MILQSVTAAQFWWLKTLRKLIIIKSSLLPAGWYYIMVVQPLLRFDKVDYHLTLDSGDPAGQACQTLEVAWPGDHAEEDFASTDDFSYNDFNPFATSHIFCSG
ncbi:MAG: hypothetical protein OES18_20680, partial [Deltaproteobacteria bacterium]|nr:hypothetical protein [Deltaproteobacteria bacterium]